MFSILNLSATLYPLIIKLQNLNLLNSKLVGEGRTNYTFFDLVELIDVRVYKTRGTDPRVLRREFPHRGGDPRSI